MRTIILIVAMLAACAVEPEPPPPAVRFQGEVDRNIERGLRVWETLGFTAFDVERDASLVECPRHWPDAIERCVLTIGVDYVGYLKRDTGAIGWAHLEARTIELDSQLIGATAGSSFTAHEIGHVLLDAGHLRQGDHGVMQAIDPPWTETPYRTDRDLACASVGICD